MDLSNIELNTIHRDFVKFANAKLQQSQTQTQGYKRSREKKPRNKTEPLKPRYSEDPTVIECGIDEAGRGPMFGRVYTACVILPQEGFDHSKIKDSKRFSSKKKLLEVYQYIKEHSVDFSVSYAEPSLIDEINIRQATLETMHQAINGLKYKPDLLLVDGCDFKPYPDIRYTTIEGGDNWYTPIAAASILAKVERDKYVEELCVQHPFLDERYGLVKNKGYGTKQHMEGIKKYGISIWHRRSFGICKKFAHVSSDTDESDDNQTSKDTL